MTHLEILAGQLDELAREATWYSAHYSDSAGEWLAGYYAGKSAALHLAADILRCEAVERAKVNKEVSE